MKNDLLSKLNKRNTEDDKTYHAFRKAIDKNLSYFSIWLEDNSRLYYPYSSLNHFTLSADAKRLLLIVAGEHFSLEGEQLEPIAKQLQSKKLEYLRELPEGETAPEDDKTVIHSIDLVEDN